MLHGNIFGLSLQNQAEFINFVQNAETFYVIMVHEFTSVLLTVKGLG